MKILLLDNWGEKAKRMLGECAEVETEINGFDYTGLITSLNGGPYNPHLFPQLKFVASCTTGLDHLPVDKWCERGIPLISLQGERDFLNSVWATAEHTWALIMSLVRKIPFAHNDVCRGNWDREAWQGMELRGKTLGIIGYGRVGQQVARLAESFGMQVVYYDKYVGQKVLYPPWERSLEMLIKSTDIITVHVPLNDETRGMFGAKQFAMMKPTAYFINTSRGAVVDEEALIRALYNKSIAGAALDVVCDEPCKYNDTFLALEMCDNLIITPHIAGNTAESRESTQLFIANKIKEFIQGGG